MGAEAFVCDRNPYYHHNRPVLEVVGEGLGLTVIVTFTTLAFTYLVSIPIGVYSATHQ